MIEPIFPEDIRPTIYVPRSGRVLLRLPRRNVRANRGWLHAVCGDRARHEFSRAHEAWAVSRSHLSPLIDATVARFGKAVLLRATTAREQCDVRCREARGDECQCACLGAHHGQAYWDERVWRLVGGTTLIHVGSEQVGRSVLASRYLEEEPGV